MSPEPVAPSPEIQKAIAEIAEATSGWEDLPAPQGINAVVVPILTRLYLVAKIEGMQEAHYECEPNGYDCGCANAVYLKLAKLLEEAK